MKTPKKKRLVVSSDDEEEGEGDAGSQKNVENENAKQEMQTLEQGVYVLTRH